MSQSTAEKNREIAFGLSTNLPRLLRELSRDYETRIARGLAQRGHPHIHSSHGTVLANLGLGAVRVTELARRARVTQQAMGKMLRELERMGYIARDVDSRDKRAREIRLTQQGAELVEDSVQVVDDVRQELERKIGESQMAQLEFTVRDTVRKLELDYLPDAWLDSAQPPQATSEKTQSNGSE